MEQIAEPVKAERLAMLQELLTAQQTQFNHQMVGRTMPILFEKISTKTQYHQGERKQWVGRSPFMQPVHYVSADDLMGKVLTCKITEYHSHSLYGELVA